MKSSINNNYSLYHIENFNKKLDDKTVNILNSYFKILIEYLQYIFENIKIKNVNYYRFIIIRGIETINNVFNYILFYTQNLEITIFHIQKSFYFYVEFIQQTSSEQNVFLELSSRDATMYVYRKTIFELNNDFRKNYVSTNKDTNEKLELINKYIDVLKSIIFNIFCKNEFYSKDKINLFVVKEELKDKNNTSDNTSTTTCTSTNFTNNVNDVYYVNNVNDVNNITNINDIKNINNYLNIYQEIGYKFISINLNQEQLKFINLFIEKINSNKISLNKFLEIINLLIKKIIKSPQFIITNKNKLYHVELNRLISEDSKSDNIISFISE